MTVPGVARAQAPPHFTVDHQIQFVAGTDQDREQLSAIPMGRMIVARPFEIAREDLNDDGTKEIIIRSTSGCTSDGCPTWVFENRHGNVVAMLNNPTLPRLAVTKEKSGSYRALAPVDDHGEIVPDNRRWQRPGMQMVYAMRRAAVYPPPSILNPEACGGDPACTEVPTFVAMVTEFRLDLAQGIRVITANVRIINKQDRPMVVAYLQGSGVVTDDQGNRYFASAYDAPSAAGEILTEHPDPKFYVRPGEIKDAHFEFTLRQRSQNLGTHYTIDISIGEATPLPSEAMVHLFGSDDPDVNASGQRQWRLGKAYPLHFSGFTDAGISPSGPTKSSPTELAGAYMSKGTTNQQRLTFTSGTEVTFDNGLVTFKNTYVVRGRKVTVTFADGDKWVYTIDGQGCLVPVSKFAVGEFCRQ